MAALTEDQRIEVWAAFMRRVSGDHERVEINKNQLRAAVDAIDNWVVANAASFNVSIPQPARVSLTTRQKAELLTMVIDKRFEVRA